MSHRPSDDNGDPAARPDMLEYLIILAIGYHGLLLGGVLSNLLRRAELAGLPLALGLATLLAPVAGAVGLWRGRRWGWWLFSGYYASQAGLVLLQLATGTPHPRMPQSMALVGIEAGRLAAHGLALALTSGIFAYLFSRRVLRFVGQPALPRQLALPALLLIGTLIALAMRALSVWV